MHASNRHGASDRVGLSRQEEGLYGVRGNRRYYPCAGSRPNCRRHRDAQCFHQEIVVTIVHHRGQTCGVASKRIGCRSLTMDAWSSRQEQSSSACPTDAS